MCDFRFAGSSARFSEGYIRVGLLPGNGGCYFLPRLVGTARALELLVDRRLRRRRGSAASSGWSTMSMPTTS